MKKAEFCSNSGQWIEFMVLMGSPPDTCPNQDEQFGRCERCAYYKKREPTLYLLRKRMQMKKIYDMMVEL